MKKRILNTLLAATCTLALMGCAKNNNENQLDTNAIYLENHTTYDPKDGNYNLIPYTKVLDFSKIDCEEISELFKNNGVTRSLASVSEEEVYTTSLLEGLNENTKAMTTGFFNNFCIGNYIIWPSSLEYYPKHGIFTSIINKDNCYQEITIQNLTVLNSDIKFKYVYAIVLFKKTPSAGYLPILPPNGSDVIEKNDYLKAEWLFDEKGNVVAFNQTGVGSDSSNIVPVGNMEEALTDVISYQALTDYLSDVNDTNVINDLLNNHNTKINK